MKNTKKVVVGSLATIAVSCALIGGATLAYFTDDASTNIAITAGNVEISATVDESSFQLWSMEEDMTELGHFYNGGTVEYKDGELIIDRITPGDKVAFNIDVENSSDISIKYQTQLTSDNALLLSGLDVKVDGASYEAADWVLTSAWSEDVAAKTDFSVYVEIELPKEAGNVYKTEKCTLTLAVNAIQANGEANNLIEVGKNHYIANSAESLIAFAKAVNGGEFSSITAREELVTLDITADIDLADVEWIPMNAFRININGNGHTIKNINAVESEKAGFLGYLGGSTVKDLTLENVKASGQQVGAIVGRFEDARITNVTLAGAIDLTWTEGSDTTTGNDEDTVAGAGAFIGVWQQWANYFGMSDVTNNATIAITVLDGVESILEEADGLYIGTLYGYGVLPADSLTITDNGVIGEKIADGLMIGEVKGVNTYLVSNANGLTTIVEMVNDIDHPLQADSNRTNITLTTDIDFGGENLDAICAYAVFIDGDGHTISNFKIEGPWASLFGIYASGKVTNLTVKDAEFTGTQAGVFAAHNEGITIENCKLDGNIVINYEKIAGEDYAGVGAFIGVNQGGTITGCEILADCTVTINSNGATVANDWDFAGVTNNGKVEVK